MVRSDGVEDAGPAVARVPEAVKEDHGGGLFDARPKDYRTHGQRISRDIELQLKYFYRIQILKPLSSLKLELSVVKGPRDRYR